MFISGLEIVGLKKRVIGGNIMTCTYALGQVAAASVAWAIPYWRTYTLAIFSPSLLFIFYVFFVEESVRWLIAKGQRDEAVRIIFKIAKFNKATLSAHTMRLLTEGTTKRFINTATSSRMMAEPKKKSLLRKVLSSRIIIVRLMIVSFWWVSTTTIYYGLGINAVTLMGNMYINYILTSLVEIPGALLSLLTLDRFGRKGTIMTGFFACGIALLLLPLVDNRKS